MAEQEETQLKKTAGQEKPQAKKILGMNKKTLIIALGALVLAGVAFGVFLDWNGTQVQKNAPQNNEAEPRESEPEAQTIKEVQEIMKQAAKKDDLSLCKNIEDNARVAQCENYVHLSAALQNKDLERCDKISRDTQVQACKNNVYFSKAVGNKDETLCDNIVGEEEQTRCVETVQKLNK